MGLYDRDYMREPAGADGEDASGRGRLALRRRVIIIVGTLILAAGLVLSLLP